MLESVDGGTTATIIALLDGATLVMAQVGDSSALLGGTIGGGDDDAEVAFEELMEEHSATNVKEYVRVKESGPRGQALNFVYDVHDLIEKGKLDQCAIFKKSNGQFEMDVRSKRLAEVHGTPAKNARGDLPAILLTPENDEAPFESMEPQSLAMTRSSPMSRLTSVDLPTLGLPMMAIRIRPSSGFELRSMASGSNSAST